MITRQRIVGLGLVAAIIFVMLGCKGSDRVQVTGRVTRKSDGKPMVGAKVAFRSPATGQSAIGYTNADGNYTLGTERVGEGLPAGEYNVSVAEDRGPAEDMRQPTVSAKYEIPSTSGLTFVVKPSGSNTYDIVLDPP